MWAKLVQTLLMPLIQKSVVALFHYLKDAYQEWQRKRKLKKENDKKIKAFKESKVEEDITDTFSNLP